MAARDGEEPLLSSGEEEAPVASLQSAPESEPADETVTVAQKTWSHVRIAAIVLAFLTVGLAVALGVVGAQLASERKDKAAPVQPPEPPLDESPDFPLKAPEPFSIGASHTETVSIDARSVTWSTVSVHGDDLYFDALGDVFRVSIADALAGAVTLQQPLLGGVAWQVFPQVSPDGKTLAYTSDENGNLNLFLRLSNGETVQVTDERYQWLANPTWSPDGTRVVCVKFYYTERSMGSGELWEYDVAEFLRTREIQRGTRLVGRTSSDSQIGPEEPAYAADGSVFFSLNRRDESGGVWQYNKDPHAGIYEIRRVHNGQVSTVAGGYGGAARPQPSPNGDLLAFVRRVKFDTALVLRRLSTGEERIVSRDLALDQQEASATSGVYPGFAWSDDSSRIFVSLKNGHIAQLDVSKVFEPNAAAPIPTLLQLRLQYDKKVARTVKYDDMVEDGKTFDAKLRRFLDVSDDGSSVTYNAAGVAFRENDFRQVASRAAVIANEALTDTDLVAQTVFVPSQSPLSDVAVVQLVWDDRMLTSVYLVKKDGSAKLVNLPRGRYAYPAFNRDGTKLLLTRRGGDLLSGTSDALGTGVYVHDVREDGLSEGVLVSPKHSRAHFAYADEREVTVLYSGARVAVFDADNTELKSLNVRYGTEVAVSEDLKYVAFVEFRRVHVLELDLLAQTEAALVTSSHPKHRGAAESLCTLTEALGHNLVWRHKKLFFLFADGVEEYDPASGKCLTNGYYHRTPLEYPTTEKTLLLTNAAVLTFHDGDGDVPQQQSLCVKGRLFAPLSDCADADKEVDLAGALVTPGFIDAHAHWWGGSDYFAVRQSHEYAVNVAYGVTSMHNPSCDTVQCLYDAEVSKRTKRVSPRLFTTGTILYGADGPYRVEIPDEATALGVLKAYKEHGAWSVKSYNHPQRSVRNHILEAARRVGIRVVPEGGSMFQNNINHVVDGHT